MKATCPCGATLEIPLESAPTGCGCEHCERAKRGREMVAKAEEKR